MKKTIGSNESSPSTGPHPTPSSCLGASDGKKRTIGFLGAGRWALTLAAHLDAIGFRVTLWETESAALQRLQSTRSHPDLPPSFALPSSVTVTDSLTDTLADATILVFAVPSAALAAVAQAAAKHNQTCQTIVTVTKGLEPQTQQRLSCILQQAFPQVPVVVLAGPGIPYAMAAGDPTSLVAASQDERAAEVIRDTFTGGNLRVYSHNDVAGVELGAALKNVIAIAAGVADGLGLGINAKAALLTRGLAEIMRLGQALNTNPLTYAGLTGIGDLIVTAFSEYSRNHRLGQYIGQGTPPADALHRLNGVAEGAVTCRSARKLAARHKIEMPITEEVYQLLYAAVAPRESLARLLGRRPKPEVWR